MLKYLVALLLAACTPSGGESNAPWPALPVPTPGDVVAVWEGPTTLLCDPTLVRVEVLPRSEVVERCMWSEQTEGCFLAGFPSLALVAEDGVEPVAFLVAHELTHWMFFCSNVIDMERYEGTEHGHPLFAATMAAIKEAS